MTVLDSDELNHMIQKLTGADEVRYEYANGDWDSNAAIIPIKRIYVTKEGKTKVFYTGYPEARKTLQRQGKKVMSFQDFLNGARDFIGSVLK